MLWNQDSNLCVELGAREQFCHNAWESNPLPREGTPLDTGQFPASPSNKPGGVGKSDVLKFLSSRLKSSLFLFESTVCFNFFVFVFAW